MVVNTLGSHLEAAYNCAISQGLVLFNNKEILIGNQPFFIKNGFRKESSFYRIFYRKMGNFLHSHSSSKSTVLNAIFLIYVQVVYANFTEVPS